MIIYAFTNHFFFYSDVVGGPGVKSKVSGKTISGVKRPTDSDTTQAPITKKATTVETKENSAPVS